MTYLLDVNVLVSLFDGSHVNHDAAHDWFADRGRRSWATCPITENGCFDCAPCRQGRLATFDGSLLRSLRGTALAAALELLRA